MVAMGATNIGEAGGGAYVVATRLVHEGSARVGKPGRERRVCCTVRAARIMHEWGSRSTLKGAPSLASSRVRERKISLSMPSGGNSLTPEEPSGPTSEGANRPAGENAAAEATGRLTPAPAGVVAVAGSRTTEVGPMRALARADVADCHAARQGTRPRPQRPVQGEPMAKAGRR
jgi:hypothetical protein